MTNLNISSVFEAGQYDGEGARHSMLALEYIAAQMGEAPTLIHWDSISSDYKAGYHKAFPQVDGGTKAWSVVAAKLKMAYALEKPKAATQENAKANTVAKTKAREDFAAQVAAAKMLPADMLQAEIDKNNLAAIEAKKLIAKEVAKNASKGETEFRNDTKARISKAPFDMVQACALILRGETLANAIANAAEQAGKLSAKEVATLSKLLAKLGQSDK